MEKGILLNDNGLKVNCILEDNNISFEFDKNLDFLSDLLRIEKTDNLIFVYLGLKKILRIENDNIERVLPVKETDIKILKALYENNKDINSRNMLDIFNSVKNNINSFKYNSKTTTRTFGLISKVKTITHNSLIEILEAKELIRFLNEYDIKYPMNEYAELDFASDKYYRYDELEYYGWVSNLEKALKVNIAKDVSLDRIDKVIKNREQLLKLACLSLEEMLGESVEWQKIETDIKEASDDIIGQIKSLDEYAQDKSKAEKKKFNKEKVRLNEKLNKLNKLKSAQAAKILYNELLNISLDKLTNAKVDYSIVSFSNDSRLEFMSMKHKGDKRFNFLYNIDKDKSVKKFEDYAKSLEGLLNTDMVIGSDITGFENGVSNEEYDSLKEKLEVILPVLHLHPQSILRICASGFKDSTETIHKVMGAIYEVCAKLNESCVDMFGSEWGILPPPRLRLAHGLKLEDNKDLIKLIHGFDAVVEYTLSTNRTLRKVSDFSKLSLGYYDKNKIKYVFSNDLGGLYYFDNKEIENIVVDTKQDILAALQEKPFVVPMVEEKEEQKTEIKEEPKVEPVKEEIKEEKIEPIKEEVKEEPKVIQQINEIEDEITEEENSLEQTLYDLFAELKNNSTDDVVPEEEKLTVPMVEEETQEEKQEVEEEKKEEAKEEVHIEESNIDNKDYNSYAEALEDENKIFTYDGNVLSESEKVNDEIFRIRKYVSENTNDLDNDYIEKKISVVNSYNDNSNNSDYAKMYLFLLEREMLPDFNTAFKSVEYLYKNKDKEKDNIEKELDRIFNMVTDQYDHE